MGKVITKEIISSARECVEKSRQVRGLIADLSTSVLEFFDDDKNKDKIILFTHKNRESGKDEPWTCYYDENWKDIFVADNDPRVNEAFVVFIESAQSEDIIAIAESIIDGRFEDFH